MSAFKKLQQNVAKQAEKKARLAEQQKKEKEAERAVNARNMISSDAEHGIKFAQEKLGLGEGSLGRATKVSQIDTKRYEDLSKGMSAEELQANRDKAKEEINVSTQLQNRRLQAIQANQGIRGATAGSQQLGIMQQGEDRKADFERELFLRDREARIQGLNNLSTVQQYNQENQVEQERFNLGQAAQEKYDLSQSALSFAQLGLSERQAEKAREAQEKAAASAGGCFSGDTEVLMYNNEVKKIKDIKVGDITAKGGVVYNLFCGVNTQPAYLYDGVAITGNHAIFHEGKFQRINEIPGLDVSSKVKQIYNMSTVQHRIIVKGNTGLVECADFDECGNPDDLSAKERLDILNG